MLFRAVEPELAEHPGHALVGLVQLSIKSERGFVLRARAGDVLLLAQEVAEIHAPHDVVGMMRNGLCIRRARRRSIAARPGERPELVERIEIARILAQHLDIGLLGGIVLPCAAERASALEGSGEARHFIRHCSSRILAALELHLSIGPTTVRE